MEYCRYLGTNQQGKCCGNKPIYSEITRKIIGYVRCELIKDCYYKQLLAEQAKTKKLTECFIPLNQEKYYCSKKVYDILQDTNNEWQRVSQLEFIFGCALC